MTSEIGTDEAHDAPTPAGRPARVEPFLRGCAFDPIEDVPYPRAPGGDQARLPADTWASACIPVGVRIEVTGPATHVELRYETTTDDLGYRGPAAGSTFTAWRGDRLLAEEPARLGAHAVVLPLTDGTTDDADRVVVHLPEGMRPTIRAVTGIGGELTAPPHQPRWVCYGDSIAEGWVASGPAHAWPAVAGRRFGLDVVNLGYAGAARGEMVSAEAIAATKADVISLGHGTNCWTRVQHRADQVGVGLDAFLDLVRDGHPTTPIVVASPVLRPDAEHTSNRLGASLADLRAAIETVVLARIERGDDRLHLVPGRNLLGPEHLADGIHPGDAGHGLLADAIGGAVVRALAASGG